MIWKDGKSKLGLFLRTWHYVQNTFWDLVIFKADILEAKRETMNDSFEDETEFGPNDQDKEMLVTSATWAGNWSLDFFLDEWVFYADHM